MATTAGGIITAASIKVGVETPTTAQTATALISLNNMISMMGAEGMIYSVTSEGFTVASGDSEYTIGSVGQWVTARPLRVISCYLRDTNNYDYSIKVISGAEYNQIINKSFTARPTALYFLPEYPLAKIIFNCSPDSSYSAYFEFLKNFTEFASTSTSVTLPDEYKEYLVYNLAVSIGEDWDRSIPKTVIAKAELTKDTIERIIASQKRIPLVRFDFAGFKGVDDGGYNIAQDEHIDGGTF